MIETPGRILDRRLTDRLEQSNWTPMIHSILANTKMNSAKKSI